jgi:glutamate 5-kinase
MKSKRIVIKIGSSLLFDNEGRLDCALARNIAGQVSELISQGLEVVIVSSGAIASGMSLLKFANRPKELAYLQAAAAAGQPELMAEYRTFFKERQLTSAQLLLTWEDFDNRKRFLNAKHTLLTLLKLKVVPVINENDTVSTDEIKFGDNDRLSALVASMIGADLLIILSDVEGLLDKDKKNLIPVVERITHEIRALACSTNKKICVGGMSAKLDAAAITTGSGIPCVIANGKRKDAIICSVERPGACGTLFIPRESSLEARKRWIAYGSKAKGKIIVDDGAKQALLKKNSLLSVGVRAVEGEFASGDIVSLRDKLHNEFARGKIRISSRELDKSKGKRTEKEVVHRDDIVILL